MAFSISVIKYFAGWADKVTGQTIEVCSLVVFIGTSGIKYLARPMNESLAIRATNPLVLLAKSFLVRVAFFP